MRTLCAGTMTTSLMAQLPVAVSPSTAISGWLMVCTLVISVVNDDRM
ncbi:Uncharacterised protein [Mycobacteroides abscessus subsp. massiliense]|nr:Uncharacterised protein [Mycobacteroides abscessus subsp. massiliense]